MTEKRTSAYASSKAEQQTHDGDCDLAIHDAPFPAMPSATTYEHDDGCTESSGSAGAGTGMASVNLPGCLDGIWIPEGALTCIPTRFLPGFCGVLEVF